MAEIQRRQIKESFGSRAFDVSILLFLLYYRWFVYIRSGMC